MVCCGCLGRTPGVTVWAYVEGALVLLPATFWVGEARCHWHVGEGPVGYGDEAGDVAVVVDSRIPHGYNMCVRLTGPFAWNFPSVGEVCDSCGEFDSIEESMSEKSIPGGIFKGPGTVGALEPRAAFFVDECSEGEEEMPRVSYAFCSAAGVIVLGWWGGRFAVGDVWYTVDVVGVDGSIVSSVALGWIVDGHAAKVVVDIHVVDIHLVVVAGVSPVIAWRARSQHRKLPPTRLDLAGECLAHVPGVGRAFIGVQRRALCGMGGAVGGSVELMDEIHGAVGGSVELMDEIHGAVGGSVDLIDKFHGAMPLFILDNTQSESIGDPV